MQDARSRSEAKGKGATRPPERNPLLDDAAQDQVFGAAADVDAEDLAKLISVTDPRHPIVEAYRRLRTNLQYYSLDAGLTSIMLASAEAGEGKSITSANLAVVMAQSGARVILVDADLRKPRQHHIFRLLRLPGLAEALRSGFSPDLLQPVAGVPNLRVLRGRRDGRTSLGDHVAQAVVVHGQGVRHAGRAGAGESCASLPASAQRRVSNIHESEPNRSDPLLPFA